jgi:hypothetical protein
MMEINGAYGVKKMERRRLCLALTIVPKDNVII